MEGLRRLAFSRRLALLIAIFTLGFAVCGAWSLRTLGHLKVNGPLYQRIVQDKDLIADVLPPPEYILESYLVCFQLMAAHNAEEQTALVTRLQALKKDYDERHAYWRQQPLDADVADGLLRQAHAPAFEFYQIAQSQFVPAVQRADTAAAGAAMAAMRKAYESHLAAINRVVDLANRHAQAVEADSTAEVTSATIMLLAVLAASVGIGIACAVVITRSITAPLAEAVAVAQVVAQGDLRATITSDFDDEPGQLLRTLKQMNASLASTVTVLRHSSDVIGTSSREIAHGNMDLSVRTEEQANSLRQTTAAMADLSRTVRGTAAEAQRANTIVLQASEVAAEGGTLVGQVVGTMESITESSRRIADILGVIDGIAFQTNILALNAAVEAARAGESGRGFAVVASEVRSLAHRSAEAAKQIKTLIASSADEVGNGATLAVQARETMEKVVAAVSAASDIMAAMTAATQGQHAAIEQVAQAIAQMDEVTQQNAAMVEQAAAAAANMQEQASQMIGEIGFFQLPGAPAAARDRCTVPALGWAI